MKATKSFCSILAGCVFFNYQVAAEMKVPKGFESLAQGQEQWVAVSLYNENLGLYKAKVSLENVFFLQPELLIRKIESKLGSSESLANLLSSGLTNHLDRHDSLSCSNNNGAIGCGYINPKTVALIYDESNDSAQLFLPGEYITSSVKQDSYFSNAEESHNGFIHQQSINIVGDKVSQSLSLQGNGTIGLADAAFGNIDWSYNDQRYRSQKNTSFIINNAYVRHDLWRKIYLQAGSMDSRDIFSNAGGRINLNQLQLNKLYGIRIGSTQAWVNKDKNNSGTPLMVSLSNDSRVDAYRGDQLLGSFYFHAGLQKIDTSNFPSGSYSVSLRIYVNNQLVRTQNTPFSNIEVSGENDFRWFMQAGRLAKDFSNTDSDENQIIAAGARLPLTKSLALTAGATLLKGVNYTEGALDWSHGFDSGLLDGVMTARTSYLHGSDGSSGNVQQLSYNDGFSLSLYRTSMTTPECGRARSSQSRSGCSTDTNVTFSIPVKGWTASLGYTDSKSEGHYGYLGLLDSNDPRYGRGAPWEMVYTTRSRSRAWQAGISKSFLWNGLNIGTTINTFMRKDNSYLSDDKGGFITLNLSTASAKSSTSLNSTWNGSRHTQSQLGYGVSYSQYNIENSDNEVGASINGINTGSIDTLIYKQAGGQYGRGTLTLSDSYNASESSHTPSVSANYNSAVAIDRDGLFWGRWANGLPSAAVTFGVDAGDNSKSSLVNVGVDGSGQANVGGNSRALFTVPGYQQTNLTVQESQETSKGISSEIIQGAGSRKLFMIPGKVFDKKISVQNNYTWLGRMIDSSYLPLDNAIPLNVKSWSPLGNGGFSLETTHQLQSLYLMRNSEYLECPVRTIKIRDAVHWVGTITCASVTLASLPAAEKKQVKLMTAGVSKVKDEMALTNNTKISEQ